MCVQWAADTWQESQKDTGERGAPNGGFSRVESKKLSPLSSQWGARSQPEALGPGRAAARLH